MATDIEVIEQELWEARAHLQQAEKNAGADEATWKAVADHNIALKAFLLLSMKHMPAILDALDQVRRQRDDALTVAYAVDNWISADHGMSKSASRRLALSTALRRFRTDHPHLFAKGGPDAK